MVFTGLFHNELITLLQSIATTGVTGTTSLSVIQKAVTKGFITDNVSARRPWTLTPTGCEVLSEHILSSNDETNNLVSI